jgi:hypothetical protein
VTEHSYDLPEKHLHTAVLFAISRSGGTVEDREGTIARIQRQMDRGEMTAERIYDIGVDTARRATERGYDAREHAITDLIQEAVAVAEKSDSLTLYRAIQAWKERAETWRVERHKQRFRKAGAR